VRTRRPLWFRWLLPVAVALLALNAVTFLVFTLPRGYDQRNRAAQVRAAREELAAARRSLDELRGRAQTIRSNRVDLSRFYAREAGSQTADLVPTLEAIEAMARAPGLRPGTRSISRAAVGATRLERVRVTLPLEGSYAQLVGFLGEVERSDRFLTIDRVSMRATASRGATLQVQLSAYLRTAPGEGRKRGGGARG
jgi:Tfp pilus assembly protein PilO